MENIFIIGNSHSVDAFQLLSLAYKDQKPGEDVTLGILYYSGCSITRHIDFGKNKEAVCTYYKNSNGLWDIEKHVDMDRVLSDEPWEKVFFQAAKSDLDETLNRPGRRELEKMGHVFKTRSDTEVVLRSYIQWGAEFLDRLNGIFAFSI